MKRLVYIPTPASAEEIEQRRQRSFWARYISERQACHQPITGSTDRRDNFLRRQLHRLGAFCKRHGGQ